MVEVKNAAFVPASPLLAGAGFYLLNTSAGIAA